MSQLMATLYPERFIPPPGVLMTYGEKPISKTDGIKSMILNLVESGINLDTDIAMRVQRSENCVRTYLSLLVHERLIKRVEICAQGKGRGAFKMRYLPMHADVDIDALIETQPTRSGKSPVTPNLRKSSEAYSKAMEGMGWMTTDDIANKLGKSRPAAYKTLSRMDAAGIVDQRMLGVHRQHGYEWRLK